MNEIKFACPHCQQHIACDSDYADMCIGCPSCGKPMTVPVLSASGTMHPEVCVVASLPAPRQGFRSRTPGLDLWTEGEMNGWIFFAVMFAPPLLTIAATLLGAKQGDTAPTIAVMGGGVSGIICGVMLARRFGNTATAKIVLGIIFTVVIGAACIAMGCFGCVASGYELNIH